MGVRSYRVMGRGSAGLMLAVAIGVGACAEAPGREAVDLSDEQLEAWAPTRVADVIETSIDARAVALRGQDLQVHQEGARFLKLHFDRVHLDAGEAVLLLDRDGTIVERLGPDAQGRWSRSVRGDTAFIRFQTRGDASWARLIVDELAVGRVDPFDDQVEDEDFTTRSICGSDDKERAACFDGEIAESAATVARLLFPSNGGMAVCTGALISAEGHFITNNHCIDSQDDLDNTEFLFNYQKEGCSGGGNADQQEVTGGTFIRTSAELDYTLVKLDGNLAETYGFLEIDAGPVSAGTEIYIPQHPGGRQKEIAAADGDGICDVQSTNLNIFGYTPGSNIGYNCDTEGGSSGSPVIRANDHRLIALHHVGGCNNGATAMQFILPEISDDLGVVADDGGGADGGGADGGGADGGGADGGGADGGGADGGGADGGGADGGGADGGGADGGGADDGGADGGGADGGSCEDRCGVYAAGESCQCDAACSNYGDCCEDLALQCGGAEEPEAPDEPDEPAPTSGSCEDRCGAYDPGQECQCDSTCSFHGDCCADKADACGE